MILHHTVIEQFASQYLIFCNKIKPHTSPQTNSGNLVTAMYLDFFMDLSEECAGLQDFDFTLNASKNGLVLTPINKYSQIIWNQLDAKLNQIREVMGTNNENSKYSFSSS